MLVIDPKLLRTDSDRLRRAQEARGESPELISQLVSADETRRSSIASFERLRAEQKELGALIPKASGDEKVQLLARAKELAAQVKDAQATSDEAGATFDALMLQLPNPVFDDVPRGGEDDFVVVEKVGTPRDFEAAVSYTHLTLPTKRIV